MCVFPVCFICDIIPDCIPRGQRGGGLTNAYKLEEYYNILTLFIFNIWVKDFSVFGIALTMVLLNNFSNMINGSTS